MYILANARSGKCNFWQVYVQGNVISGKCTFREMYIRNNAVSAKCFSWKCNFWKLFLGEVYRIRKDLIPSGGEKIYKISEQLLSFGIVRIRLRCHYYDVNLTPKFGLALKKCGHASQWFLLEVNLLYDIFYCGRSKRTSKKVS